MTSNQVRYITAFLALTGGILSVGDKLASIPGLPGWLTSSWPVVFALAGIFDRVAHALLSDPTKPNP